MPTKGETWNESVVYDDPITLRKVRRLTGAGLYNITPTHHTGIGFTADGEFLIFGSARHGKSALCRCHVPSGEITQLTDPAEGMGTYTHLSHGNGVEVGNGLGIAGLSCLAPRSGWAVYTAGFDLCAVNISTLEERVLIPGLGPDWIAGVPSIDPAERSVLLPTTPAHPDIAVGRRVTRSYHEWFAAGGFSFKLLEVPLEGGESQVVYEEEDVISYHVEHCPTDPDLLLLDRDPPHYRYPTGKITNRIWTLRLSSGELTELPPQDESRLQMHAVWTWDGQNVIYHGPSVRGGWYIGVIDRNGETVREYCFPQAQHYGHTSAAADRPAIILDGNLSRDLLLFLYYDSERPRVEVIARHGSDWNGMIGQFPHPHPQSDPTGRYISFNAAKRGRSDVYVVEV